MSSIKLDNACIDFPIFNTSSRSAKKSLIKFATGGLIKSDDRGIVVVRAIDGVTISIQAGDRLGIVGPNGAGKSSFLRLLSGVYPPTDGHVTINGKIVSLINITLGTDTEATGRENIFLRGRILGLDHRTIKENLESIIEFSELGDFIDMPVRTYSTGMSLRLAFSISTAIHPEILIMDEWLSVGDQSFVKKAEKRMVELVNKSDILVLASHSKVLLSDVCSRIVWLEHGKIVMDGPTEEVLGMYFDKI